MPASTVSGGPPDAGPPPVDQGGGPRPPRSGEGSATGATAGAAAVGSLGPASAAETNKDVIRAYLERVGRATGVDPRLLVEIGRLESGLRPNAVNRGANSPEHKWPKGMFQYRTGTFDHFNAKARRELPQLFEGLGPPNVMDWRQQAITTAWALNHGYARRWSTYDRALRNVGAA